MDLRDSELAELKREIAALRERDQDLIDFIENGSLALHWVDSKGCILWANQAEMDLLGYTRQEYIGHNIAEFHEDPPAIQDILHRLQHRETLRNYEARLRARDGTIRHVLISSNVRWHNDNFLHSRCFTRDITDRKSYEQRILTQFAVGRILASAASLEAAAPRILEVVGLHLAWSVGLLWTPHEDEPLLHAASSWENAAKSTGFAAVSAKFTFSLGVGLPGRVWTTKGPAWIADLSQDGNFPRLRLAEQHGLRSAFAFPIVVGEEVHGVMEFFDTEGRSVDEELLRMAGSLGYQIGEFLQRTRAQQELAEREESYRVLTETASDGILTVDAAGAIVFANTAAGRIFGYAADEMVGSNLAILMPEPQRTAYQAGIARYLASGEKPTAWHAIRLSGQHRAGYEVPVEVSFGEYWRGSKRFFVGVIRDIAERIRLDDTLRQSAKLESLGVLAGGIAHDFNNLLTGILGNTSLALELLGLTSPASPMLQDAIEASERAANLTRQLLAYAGKGRFLIEPTDISALIREISALIRSSIPKHVTLRLDLEQPLPPVEADASQIQQLVMNLVINGAEAIPEDRQGTVLVLTRKQEVDERYLASLGTAELAPGSYVAMSVHDNGLGMDEATLGKIFDPFFTTKFTGRGLGLAAARGIVNGHKGMLKVFSSPGQGTTFRVLLPVAGPAPVREAERTIDAELSGEGTVLVVDDEPVVRKLATNGLSRYGYTVVTAEDGRQGVNRFLALHPELKIVILDMTMPVMSGEQALHRMRLTNPNVPIVLSSGYSEVEATSRFAGKGLAGFLQKPYTAAALAEKISGVLHGRREPPLLEP